MRNQTEFCSLQFYLCSLPTHVNFRYLSSQISDTQIFPLTINYIIFLLRSMSINFIILNRVSVPLLISHATIRRFLYSFRPHILRDRCLPPFALIDQVMIFRPVVSGNGRRVMLSTYKHNTLLYTSSDLLQLTSDDSRKKEEGIMNKVFTYNCQTTA